MIDPTGRIVARSPQFVEHVLVHDLELRPQWRKRQLDPRGRPRPPERPVICVSDPVVRDDEPAVGGVVALASDEAEVYGALVLGTRDYARKNGFTDIVLGLSGGIDSGTVSAMMASLQDQPVPVFSIGVKEQSFNELPYAEWSLNAMAWRHTKRSSNQT